MKESGSMPKVIEEEKERMLSYWKEYIKEIENQVVKRPCYYNNIRVSSRDIVRDYNREKLNGEKDRHTDDEGGSKVFHNI